MIEPFRPFANTEKALFLSRPNRFLVLCEQGGEVLRAHLPNPGRLQELLLPGRPIHLVKERGSPGRKTPYTAVAVERDGLPVMLHTLRTNDVARYLLMHQAIPGLEGARIVSSEVRAGQSRFDFLLEQDKRRILLEVKSCTLFGKGIALFPDAVTERGTRHLAELARIAEEEGVRTAVLFVVHRPDPLLFLPDYHTDIAFARAFLRHRDRIDFIPVAIRWGKDLSLLPEARRLDIPWAMIEREAKDRGTYLLVLRRRERMSIEVGRLGKLQFPEGFYIYVGSAMARLTPRIQRHRRLRKHPHWHIDALRAVSEIRGVLLIRSSDRLECEVSKALSHLADWTVPGFGSSDCSCETHLYGMKADPLLSPAFQAVLQHFRMDRLG